MNYEPPLMTSSTITESLGHLTPRSLWPRDLKTFFSSPDEYGIELERRRNQLEPTSHWYIGRVRKEAEGALETIPNTLRATEAAWSPDGSQIAFVRYGDGTHNLWTIAPNGAA